MDFIPRLAVVGVGLIGGSLALALKNAGAVGEVVGIGRGLANLEKALELGGRGPYQPGSAPKVSARPTWFFLPPRF